MRSGRPSATSVSTGNGREIADGRARRGAPGGAGSPDRRPTAARPAAGAGTRARVPVRRRACRRAWRDRSRASRAASSPRHRPTPSGPSRHARAAGSSTRSPVPVPWSRRTPRDVEERLVERDRLDERREGAQDRHDRPARRRCTRRSGARGRPPSGHARRARAIGIAEWTPKRARLVARSGDDAARSEAADDDRPAAKRRIRELLDRRVERVEVDVQDPEAAGDGASSRPPHVRLTTAGHRRAPREARRTLGVTARAVHVVAVSTRAASGPQRSSSHSVSGSCTHWAPAPSSSTHRATRQERRLDHDPVGVVDTELTLELERAVDLGPHRPTRGRARPPVPRRAGPSQSDTRRPVSSSTSRVRPVDDRRVGRRRSRPRACSSRCARRAGRLRTTSRPSGRLDERAGDDPLADRHVDPVTLDNLLTKRTSPPPSGHAAIADRSRCRADPTASRARAPRRRSGPTSSSARASGRGTRSAPRRCGRRCRSTRYAISIWKP